MALVAPPQHCCRQHMLIRCCFGAERLRGRSSKYCYYYIYFEPNYYNFISKTLHPLCPQALNYKNCYY